MIFYLFFFSFFLSIRADCLEFNQTSQHNQCLFLDTKQSKDDLERYYPYCLQCTISTYIQSDDLQWEEDNQCLRHELQCVQLKFPTKDFLEDFFGSYQRFLLALFFIDNGTNQNTLHVIIEKNSLGEINAEYLEEILRLNSSTYDVFFFEVHLQNNIIRVNRDLTELTYLAIKLILVCGEPRRRQETIYIVQNGVIFLESQSNPCSAILIPSLTSTVILPASVLLTTSTDVIEVLPISQEKSKDIVWIIVLFTVALLAFCVSMIWYCLKQLKYRYRRLSKKLETDSESSISQDETPSTPQPEPKKLSLKSKRSNRAVRALQFLDDDL